MNEEYVKNLLRNKGLKVTSQRLLVLEVMAEHPGEHLTTEEIYDLVRISCPEIGLATIYRTVQILSDLHLIDKVSFDDGIARYELGEEGSDMRHHHHHAICLKCGSVSSFEDDLLERLEEALKDRMGFEVVDHEVKLYGYCSKCRNKTEIDKE